jgi:hypothetical protein
MMTEFDLNNVLSKINKSWSVLSKNPIEFNMVTGNIKPDDKSYHFAIPVHFSEGGPFAAVALEISKAHATNLSVALYELDEKDLSEDEILDVCCEMCNVFSANVCNFFSCGKKGSITLPNTLSSEVFFYIFNGSNLNHYFQAENEDGKIVIYMFDPCNYYN